MNCKISLLTLFLTGCSSFELQHYHLTKAIDECGGIDKVHRIIVTNSTRVGICTNGKEFSLLVSNSGVKNE